MYASYKAVEWNETGLSVGTGWLPPLPDLRDFTDAEPRIVEIVKKLVLPRGREARSVPSSVDLRSWCSPVEDQKSLGSCSAHAAVTPSVHRLSPPTRAPRARCVSSSRALLV